MKVAADFVKRELERTEHLFKVDPVVAKEMARRSAATDAAIETAAAVDQLVAVAQAQHAVLSELVAQAAQDSAVARSRFWWGFVVGAVSLAVTVATLWVAVLTLQATVG